MGAIAKDKRVLKLVHPGRHVETHTKPVQAADILSKYPRHCIARPDFFKSPWILVKPSSLLVPGEVFLLVPKHTVYYFMLKASDGSLPSSASSSKDARESPIKAHAGMTTKNDPNHENSTYDIDRQRYIQLSKVQSAGQGYDHDHDHEEETIRSTATHVYDYNYYNRDRNYTSWPEHLEREEEPTCSKFDHENQLKSCFRKKDSVRRLLDLRVTFVHPDY